MELLLLRGIELNESKGDAIVKKRNERIDAGYAPDKTRNRGRVDPKPPSSETKPWQPPSEGSAPVNRKK